MVFHEWIIHEDQRLGRDIGGGAAAYGRERDGAVEGTHHGREEVVADLEVDAASTVSVERSADRRAAATIHEGRQVSWDRGAALLEVEVTGDGEDRVSDGFGFEPFYRHAVEEQVLWIGFDGGRVFVFTGHLVRRGED